MEGTRLNLNDAVIIENGRAGYSGGFLWLYFTGYTIAQAGKIVFDPGITEKITFQYGEMEEVYTGFTVCRSLMIDVDGVISVCMERERADA